MNESTIRRLREDARSVFLRAVEAARPGAAVERRIELGPHGRAVIGGEEMPAGSRLFVIALGKASVSMAEAAARKLPRAVFPGEGIAVTNRENRRPLERFTVIPSGHPVPDAAGVEAARRVASYLSDSRAGDAVLVLISGGGSALLPAPARGISLDDKMAATRLLLACGAKIQEINTIRKHISELKGGGLARAASPARTESLILSDVIGDDPSTIASGPTAPDPTTFGDALRIIDAHGLRDRVPRSVLERLEAGRRGEIPETPKPGDPLFARVTNTVIGSNRLSLQAAAERAEELGYQAEAVSLELSGEARDAGEMLARSLRAGGATRVPLAFLAGGETTVTLRGRGRGGRNQELAIGFAIAAEAVAAGAGGAPGAWVFLSGGTDGRDGPTDAAGGIVDPGTLARAAARGRDALRELERNNSYALLEASGDLLMTGGTGTNVADIQILLVAAEE